MTKPLIGFFAGIALLAGALPAFAASSEITGTISTGVSTGISGIVDATPTATPRAGTYTSTQKVTLSAAGAQSIRYTTDGTEPACSSGTLYNGAISVSSSETIRAIACYSGAASAVGIFAYGINIAAPSSGGGGGGGGGRGGGGFISTTPATNTTATSTVSALLGDINHDGVVNLLDFNTLMAEWGETGSSLPADLNHDGVVDVLDFNILIAHWTV